MNTRPIVRFISGAAALSATSYAAYAGATWLRYGHVRAAKREELDPLLDQFMPYCDVVERHSVSIRAPADVALSVAGQLDFEESPIVRALINVREFLLGSNPPAQVLPAGLLEKTKALGWGVLSEIPGREIVMGAATQPWQANVVFRSFEPWRFAAFDDPEFVKIAWTLRADPVTETTCIFRTETRVVACGPAARAKFRRYWAFLSPGIIVIRMALLGPLKRKAERRAREFRAVPAANPA